MIELNKAKEIINYIAYNDLSDNYKVFPFQDVGEIDVSQFNDLCTQFATCDLLVEDLRRQYGIIGTHLRIKPEKTPALLKSMGYFIDITNSTQSVFCGRENELLKMNIAINKKIKNNVLLVGNPGTGKTKLVEEFAIKNQFHNIYVVECAKILGSTEYRGAFEQRVIDLLNYAKKYGLTLFFDEIHTLINLGKSTGGMSITDILKPYLLDKQLVFIGATTNKEFRFFTEDEAFKRRFSFIKIDEPSDEELIEIKCSLEKELFRESLLNNANTCIVINQLRENLPTMYFPDKLIDFLDFLYSYKSFVQFDVDFSYVLSEFINDYNDVDEKA